MSGLLSATLGGLSDRLSPLQMASCGDTGCGSFNATSGKWFKIDQEGYSDGTWATDRLFKKWVKPLISDRQLTELQRR